MESKDEDRKGVILLIAKRFGYDDVKVLQLKKFLMVRMYSQCFQRVLGRVFVTS